MHDVTKDWFENENGLCKLCQVGEETAMHLFAECNMVKDFWVWLYPKIELEWQASGLNVFLNSYGTINDFQFYCMAVAKHTVWTVRNKCVFDNVHASTNLIRKVFIEQIQSELRILLRVHKRKNRREMFRERYIKYAIVCDIEDETITVPW